MSIEKIKIESRGQWLDMRRRDVTASQVAALFGCHPYMTPLQLWMQKRGEDGQQGDRSSMKRGRWLEPAVAEAVKEENPEWAPLIHKNDSYFRLPDLRLGSTPDYFIGEPGEPGTGVLECKSMLPEKFADNGEAAPLFHTLQVVVQMMTTGAAWGTIACMVMTRNLDLHLYAVPRHAAAEARIASAVAAFWEAVERGVQPPPILPQDRKTLADMFKTDNGETLDLSGDNALPSLLEERRGLKAAHKTAELRIGEIEDEVRMKLGAAAIATLPGWKITYRTSERKEFTVPAKTVRTLRIAQRNGDNHDDR